MDQISRDSGTICNKRDRKETEKKTEKHISTYLEHESDELGEGGSNFFFGKELALLHQQVLEALHLLAHNVAFLEYTQDLMGFAC